MSFIVPLVSPPPLEGEAALTARLWLDSAAGAARGATCLRSHCGAVVVKDGAALAWGENSLPDGSTPTVCRKDTGELGPGFKSDATCCTHAEVRAVVRAVVAGHDVHGASLYFTRVDPESGARVVSGAPYCTICSKFALECGLAYFVLEHARGVVAYPTDVYNELSFAYGR